MTFAVILAAMSLGAPVHCYQTGWPMPQALAYYNPGGSINLSPRTCRQVLAPTLEGAQVLAHEIAHLWQWRNRLPFNEEQADRIGRRTAPRLLLRLAAVLHRRPVIAPSPDMPVVLR